MGALAGFGSISGSTFAEHISGLTLHSLGTVSAQYYGYINHYMYQCSGGVYL